MRAASHHALARLAPVGTIKNHHAQPSKATTPTIIVAIMPHLGTISSLCSHPVWVRLVESFRVCHKGTPTSRKTGTFRPISRWSILRPRRPGSASRSEMSTSLAQLCPAVVPSTSSCHTFKCVASALVCPECWPQLTEACITLPLWLLRLHCV